jgi:2-oxoacid:acceptor oxidoreductase gamma subunit (pyruvate/2-ketoisovalerate family)
MIEVRFHGRGGQGIVTGAHLLAEAIFRGGKWVQMIPSYGGERRGAPVMASLRIDDKPIRITSQVERPDCIIVFDPIMPDVVDTEAGLKEGGVAIFNDRRSPDDLKFNYKLSKIATVDATGVAVEVFGRTAIPITNTAMVGAFAACTGWADLNRLVEVAGIEFRGEMAVKNATAVRMGFQKTRVKNL